jgi:hypothetical protein
MEPTPIKGGMGGVRSCWIFEEVPHLPLCGCCVAQSSFADLHAYTDLLSNLGQKFLNFSIAPLEQ